MPKRTLPAFRGEAQAKMDKIEADYKAAKIEQAMNEPYVGYSLHKLGADAIEAVLAAQQEDITMDNGLREAVEREIASQQAQIAWTCERLHDSQEHAQIVMLEARLEQEQKRLADLRAARTALET